MMQGVATTNGRASFWSGQFQVPCQDSDSKDTFVKLQGWSKGVVFINGFNLGLI
jgi:beta-galactosidase